MLTKTFAIIVIISTFFTVNISVSANVLDDLKNSFQTTKSKIKEDVREIRNQANEQKNEAQSEFKKSCEIQKGYMSKHFKTRQSERNIEIEEKTAKINKVKAILTSNKQDITNLNIVTENLTKLLKQKTELLDSRVKNSNAINCWDQENNLKMQPKLKDINNKIDKIDKDIRDQTRLYTGEVQMLIVKMKQPKTEEEKK
jgi:hypothetical protein